jgi:hypothetical protein
MAPIETTRESFRRVAGRKNRWRGVHFGDTGCFGNFADSEGKLLSEEFLFFLFLWLLLFVVANRTISWY